MAGCSAQTATLSVAAPCLTVTHPSAKGLLGEEDRNSGAKADQVRLRRFRSPFIFCKKAVKLFLHSIQRQLLTAPCLLVLISFSLLLRY